MKHKIVESLHGVTLAGGGPFGAALLARALALAPVIVGADGGADRLLRLGAEPTAVIGDFVDIKKARPRNMAGRIFRFRVATRAGQEEAGVQDPQIRIFQMCSEPVG